MNDEKDKLRSNFVKNKSIANIKKDNDIDMIKRVRQFFINKEEEINKVKERFLKNQLLSMENNKIDLILNDDNISTKSKKKLEPLKKTTISENKNVKILNNSNNPTLLKGGIKENLIRNDEYDVKSQINVVDLNSNYIHNANQNQNSMVRYHLYIE